MRRLLLALCPLLIASPALAGSMTLLGAGKASAGGGGGYIGPGDAAASAAGAWYGVRAYSAAKAAALAPALQVTRASNAETCDILLAATGDLGNTASCTGANSGISGSTFCSATTCSVVFWYDQTGNGMHEAQGVGANRPVLVFNCVNSKPCVTFNGSQYLAQSSSYSSSQPYTISAVAIRTSGTAQADILSGSNGVWFSAAGKVSAWFGGTQDANQTDNAWHAMQWGVNGSSSTMNVDGTSTTGLAWGSAALSSDFEIGAQGGATNPLTGKISEAGVWNSTLATQAAICHNQAAYYGITASC